MFPLAAAGAGERPRQAASEPRNAGPCPKEPPFTGITGQDGAYLAEFLLGKGHRVHLARVRNDCSHVSLLRPYSAISSQLSAYDDCTAELAAARQAFGASIHAFDAVNLMDDLDEAAALTAALDLVIAPGTAVAGMAGALGVPVWLFAPNRHSLITLGCDCCPWYPGLRWFFRPPGVARWEPVMAEIAAALRDVCAASPDGGGWRGR